MEYDNVKKMRGALLKLRSEIERFCSNGWIPYDAWQECDDTIGRALSEPARNCDVGTAVEQARRYKANCGHGIPSCGTCKVKAYAELNNLACQCGFVWAQMPYENEGED